MVLTTEATTSSFTPVFHTTEDVSLPPTTINVAPLIEQEEEKQSIPSTTITNKDVPIILSFEKLTAALPSYARAADRPILLSNINGYVRRNGITGVVGVASAGKSLLLECLSQRIQAEGFLQVEGDIKVQKGDKILTNKQSKGEVAYVPVEDILLGNLTVRQTLRYSAQLRVPNEDVATREARIEQIIQSLSLGKVADNRIGSVLKRGLSGGEKRRCSVAVELAAQPTILALDEITSGLDAFSAYQTVLTVQSIIRSASATMGAIIAIQQPNSRILELFDDLLILNSSGQCVFFGPTPHAIAYFQSVGFPLPHNTTPTDWFLHATNTSEVQDSSPKSLEI